MIKLNNIKKIYNPKKSNEFEALHGVSCEIQDGEMAAIIGKSGAESQRFCISLPVLTTIRTASIPLTGSLSRIFPSGSMQKYETRKSVW